MKATRFLFNGKEYRYVYIQDPAIAEKANFALSKSSAKMFGLDFETIPKAKFKKHPKAGLDPHLTDIRLIQIYDPVLNICFVYDLLVLYVAVGPKLNRNFIAHNGIFEIKHSRLAFTNVHCSMLMGMLIDRAEHSPFEPEIDEIEETENDGLAKYRRRGGYGLDALVRNHFGIEVSKAEQTSDWSNPVLTKSQLGYAALDAILTYELGRKLYPKIKTYKMTKAYNLLQKMQYVIAELELNGFLMDKKAHSDLIYTWEREMLAAEIECRPYFKEVNLQSSKQMNDWVLKFFKAKPQVLKNWPQTPASKPKENKIRYSFGAKDLYLLNHLPPIKALLRKKKVLKLLQTYGHTLADKISPATGRIHGSFFLGETRTGRMSSRDPNLQNMPRPGQSELGDMRSIFKAAKGNHLVIADFNQIEMRVAGEVSRDPTMLKAFLTKTDLHKLVVSKFMRIPYDKVTDMQRQLGKAVNFGLLFGMGPKKLKIYAKLSYDVELSEGEAFDAWNIFHKKLYPHYSAWCDVQRDKVKKLGFVRTPMGKMRKLHENEAYTRAINTPVQGGAAEVIYQSLVLLREMLHSVTGGLIVNCVHDEIVLEVPLASVYKAKSLLKECMELGMLKIFPKASILGLVDLRNGETWAKPEKKNAQKISKEENSSPRLQSVSF